VSQVSITFDNGPSVGVTEGVLAALAERDIPATFFVVAEQLRLAGGRALIDQARAEGHLVGNHSLTHTVPLGLTPGWEAADREITRAQVELGPLGEPERLFRPFGSGGALDERLLSPEAVEVLCAGLYTCILWNCVPHDWDDPDGWVHTALRQIDAVDEAVVVLHDLPTGAMAHLPMFLDTVIERGHHFTTDVPDALVPIRAGRIVQSLDGLVAPHPA
jgi:peptidoglycan-N-acetylglucosamine deacetylase